MKSLFGHLVLFAVKSGRKTGNLFHHCAMCEAWRELGCTQEQIAKLCSVASEGEFDVADAVLFLASGLSRYITGTTLDVNGGLYMK